MCFHHFKKHSSPHNCTKISAFIVAFILAIIMASVAYILPEKAQAAQTNYPTKIQNSGFDYPDINLKSVSSNYAIYLCATDGRYVSCGVEKDLLRQVPNWNAFEFGWKSTGSITVSGYPARWSNNIELQEQSDSDNTYCEIVADELGKAVYQDVATTPNALYKWKLDHTSIYSTHNDSMSVLIGTPTSQTPQPARRTKQNKDKRGALGNVGTIITTSCPTKYNAGGNNGTHGIYEERHALNGYWETYEGEYLCPKGQTVTRFTFQALDNATSGADSHQLYGNLIDNVSFAKYDALIYNTNGGSAPGLITSVAAAQAEHYKGYYEDETDVSLSTIQPVRNGYTFIGWAETKVNDINTLTAYENIKKQIVSKVNMGTDIKTVYAVWAKNPTITYTDPLDNNKVVYSQIVSFGSAATGLPDNILPPVHDHYDYTGYSTSLPSAVYEDTTIPLAYKGSPVKLRVQLVNAKNNSPLRWAGFDISVDAENNTTSISLETDGSGTAAFDGIAFGSYSAALTERPEGFLYPDYVTDFSADPALADAEGYITVEIPVMPQLSRRTTEYESSNDFDFYYPAWIAVYGDDELVMGRGTGYPYPQYNGKKLNENYIWLDVERRELGTRPFWDVKEKIKSVKVIDRIRPLNPQMWFLHFSACTSYDVTKLDMSACTSLQMFFGGNHAAEEIDVTGWDTSNVTTMSACFSSWGTNPDGTGFIYKDNKLKRIKGLETWDVSKVTDFNDAFSRNWNLEDIGNIGNWNMSSANTVHHMFVEDRVLKTNVSGFRKTINMNIPGLNGLCIDGNVYMCMLGIKEMKAPGVVF